MSYTINSQWFTAAENNSCTLLVNGSEPSTGYDAWGQPLQPTVEDGDIISLVPDEGFAVVSAGFSDQWGQPWQFDVSNGVATFVVQSIDGFSSSSLSITVEQTSAEALGANRVYKVDADIIKEVNEQRFFYSSGNGGEPTSVDLGTFIIGLIRIPTEIDPELILADEPIRLGGKSLTVQAPLIATDTVSFDMGTISVPRIYNDSRDYEGVVFNLHLPYSPSIAVEAEYVVDENLGIEYLIDLYTGQATINLYSTKVYGSVFLSRRVDLGVNVPFGTNTLNQANAENTNIGMVGDNRIQTPYLERIENEAFLVDAFFSTAVLDEGTLGNESGFILVENSSIEVAAFANEKEEINAILSRGIIINDGSEVSQGPGFGPNLTDTFDLSTFALQSRVQNVTEDSFEVASGETDGGVVGRQGEDGKKYTAAVHYTRLTPGDIALTVGTVSSSEEQVREPMASSGTITATRIQTGANTIYIRLYGAGASVRIDAIELHEIIEGA